MVEFRTKGGFINEKLSLSLVTSSILLSMLLIPVHTETVHAKEVENKVNSSTYMVGFKKPHTNGRAKEVKTEISSASQLKKLFRKKIIQN